MDKLILGFSEIFDRLHDAVIVTDLQGVVRNCNRAAEEVYGYNRAEFVGANIAVLYPELHRGNLRAMIDDVLDSGRADGEFLNVTKDGREIWIHLSVSLLLDEASKPYGMVGFSIDITKSREIERENRETLERYRMAQEAAGVGLWHMEQRDGEWVLSWDEQSRAILQLPPGTKPSLEVFLGAVHPQDRWQLEHILRSPLKPGETYRGEYRVKDADGQTHYVMGTGRMRYDEAGRPTSFQGIGLDITAQKRAEIELDRTRAKYRAFLDSPFIGVATGTLERFTDLNEAFCTIVGYTREELLTGQITWQSLTPPEFLSKDFIALQELMEVGTATPFEKEYIRSDGKRVRVILGAVLVSREPLEWSCFALDVTEHHRALEALRASDMTAAASRLGHLLAHEINNPLASLTNVLYLLQHGSPQPNPELLSAAQGALERITRITRQMIGIYGEKDRITKFQVASVLEDTLAAVETRALAKNLRVVKNNTFGVETFTGIESEFRRLLASLLENAVEHTPPGGTIRVRLSPGKDWTSPAESGLRMTIADNGPGIARSQMPNLFQPFSSSKQHHGAGLGLWMCRTIAERHGGSVKLKSSVRPGRSGTTVAVFLPKSTELQGGSSRLQ